MVWQILEKNPAAVVHDVKMVGGSGVKHQIDVKIDYNGSALRVLIECKDFDVGANKKKVGLGILRDFRSVVEEVGPINAGYVVTCTGFTRDAIKYAEHHKIRLATLKVASDSHRIQSIHLNIKVRTATNINVTGLGMSQADGDRFERERLAVNTTGKVARDDDIQVVDPTGQISLTDWIANETVHAAEGKAEGSYTATLSAAGASIVVAGGLPIPFTKIDVTYDVAMAAYSHSVIAEQIAELVFTELGQKGMVVFDTQLRAVELDATGTVQPKP